MLLQTTFESITFGALLKHLVGLVVHDGKNRKLIVTSAGPASIKGSDDCIRELSFLQRGGASVCGRGARFFLGALSENSDDTTGIASGS